jgi:hypothetical protein
MTEPVTDGPYQEDGQPKVYSIGDTVDQNLIKWMSDIRIHAYALEKVAEAAREHRRLLLASNGNIITPEIRYAALEMWRALEALDALRESS